MVKSFVPISGLAHLDDISSTPRYVHARFSGRMNVGNIIDAFYSPDL